MPSIVCIAEILESAKATQTTCPCKCTVTSHTKTLCEATGNVVFAKLRDRNHFLRQRKVLILEWKKGKRNRCSNVFDTTLGRDEKNYGCLFCYGLWFFLTLQDSGWLRVHHQMCFLVCSLLYELLLAESCGCDQTDGAGWICWSVTLQCRLRCTTEPLPVIVRTKKI